jgi:ferritin-like metal-binding protein YciE
MKKIQESIDNHLKNTEDTLDRLDELFKAEKSRVSEEMLRKIHNAPPHVKGCCPDCAPGGKYA